MSERQLDVLLLLVARASQIISEDDQPVGGSRFGAVGVH